MMRRYAAMLAVTFVAGCSNSVASMSCSDIAAEAIRISEGDIVAINNQALVSKNDQRIVCRGTALWKKEANTPIRFQAYHSDDGQMIIEYDDDEHQARLEADAKTEQQREWAETERQVDRMVDDAMAVGRHEATH